MDTCVVSMSLMYFYSTSAASEVLAGVSKIGSGDA